MVAPIGFVWMDSAPSGFVHRDFVRRDLGFAPQHSIYYQTDLQEHHTVVGNSGKGLPAVVDNFDMGQMKFSLGVVGSHTTAGLQIDFVEQAEFDRPVGIERQPTFEDRMGPGVQSGA